LKPPKPALQDQHCFNPAHAFYHIEQAVVNGTAVDGMGRVYMTMPLQQKMMFQQINSPADTSGSLVKP